MTSSVDSLLRLLDVTATGPDTFTGSSTTTTEQTRLFGGQVLGQSLAAAGHTVASDRPPHSLHAYFLRPGLPDEPVTYTVESIREGHSFSTRSVAAHQGGKQIFEMTASFQVTEHGLDHQAPIPTTTAPHLATSITANPQDDADIYAEWGSVVDLRRVPQTPDTARNGRQVWMRTIEPMPDDPLLHAYVLACISDLTLLSVALVPHNISMRHDGYLVASLDHSMWFHRPARVDEWLRYDQRSPAASAGLALAKGSIYTTEGMLVATVAQQGIIRSIAV